MTQPHPIAVIQAAKINFQYGSEKPIQSQTTPTKFINIKSDIKNRIEQFGLLTKCAISSHSLSEDDTQNTMMKFDMKLRTTHYFHLSLTSLVHKPTK